ncbi:MAG: hypothetical protein IK142_02395 [Clostridiales bacterium]|nr:hypothetical protein [Clostridiales bacterium]
MAMRRLRTIPAVFILLMYLVLCGCTKTSFDNEQVFHSGAEEFEHVINDELGDYLSIIRYQTPDNNRLYIEVYLRSSYCDNSAQVEETPIWSVVDRFRCISNDFLRDNPGYFGDSHTMLECVFERDLGGYTETVASIRNHITSYDHYDYFVTESIDADYSLLQNKEDILCLYMFYNGDIENPTTEECFDYFCEQIDAFPSLEYIYILPIPSTNADDQEVIQMILDRYGNLTTLNDYNEGY